MKFSKELLDRVLHPKLNDPLPGITFEQAVIHFERLGLLVELEERAAILEYDGGLCRAAAEARAVADMLKREKELPCE